LTSEERIELESLARSTKTEYRVRVKARIVLMAADGAATRGIAREVGCAIRIDPRLLAESGRDMVLDPNRSKAPRSKPSKSCAPISTPSSTPTMKE
jgi:hypothetical protein